MPNCYVKAYYDWIEQTAALSDAERGRLLVAVLQYGRSGIEPKLDGRESILFPVLRATIDRDARKSKACAQNGALGGRGNKANESQQKLNKANESQIKLTKANESKNETERREEGFPPCPPSSSPPITPVSPTPYNPPSQEEKERVLRAKRFTPPTLAEVQSYVAERHSAVDPQEFLDFYASKGWMVGKTPMKDWKAACRNAEKWDRWRGITPREEDRYGRYTGYSGQNQSTPRRIPGELVLE